MKNGNTNILTMKQKWNEEMKNTLMDSNKWIVEVRMA